MTRKRDESKLLQSYMGFEIRELEGWYIAMPLRPGLWKSFEAQALDVLEHKIERWWVAVG